MNPTSTPAARLAAKLVATESGCHEWQGARNQHGYGNIVVGGLMSRTHRVAWQLANGPIPAGMHVLHHCDNPPCCNPEHLFLGTPKTNAEDKTAKGRDRNRPRLTIEQADELRARHSAGESVMDLVRATGVPHSVVYPLVRGDTYRRPWLRTPITYQSFAAPAPLSPSGAVECEARPGVTHPPAGPSSPGRAA